VLRRLPHGFDLAVEQVDRGSDRHGVGSLDVLVHGPELVDGLELSHRLDRVLTPPVLLVNRIIGVSSIQNPAQAKVRRQV